MPQGTNNPTSFRLPFNLPEEVHKSVHDAFRLTFQGLLDANNAIGALAPQSGTTAQRPSSDTIRVGQNFFDQTLGIQVTWNGTNWVNSSGASV
jgi:hypothetical protein